MWAILDAAKAQRDTSKATEWIGLNRGGTGWDSVSVYSWLARHTIRNNNDKPSVCILGYEREGTI